MYAKTWLGMDFDASHKSPDDRGLPSNGPPAEQSSARPNVAPAALQSKRGFLKFFQLALQLLTVFVQLLQRFITIYEIMI
jgi:hypothetical protein